MLQLTNGGPFEKTAIARMLDQAGIPFIEVGIPAMGRDEQDQIRDILELGLKASLFTWNRLVINDIRASLECGARFVHISVPVIHAHNDFGMATANTLAAVKGGARFISTMVNGIGERAGNASLQEVVSALDKLFGMETNLRSGLFPLLAKFVHRAARAKPPVSKDVSKKVLTVEYSDAIINTN